LFKKVYVIIVTYNGARWIDKNILSLLDSDYPVSIIAVDNKSTDTSLALLQKYPEVEIIQSEVNLGFGKANNIGMQRALDLGADYLFLLNQDTWVFSGTVRSLIEASEANPYFGIVSPLHFMADGHTFDANFETYFSKQKQTGISGVVSVPFVNAAAWMLSRDCVHKVGYFEPLFGHYGEDRNYCDRVLYHNFQIVIAIGGRICHDRVIIRNFTKDVTQSKYKILATLLNINHSFAKSYLLGLKEVLGLPKYFSKFYSTGKAFSLFVNLAGYYTTQVFKMGQIIAARNNAK